MKTSPGKSFQLGAITGFTLAVLYAIFFLIVVETYAPVYDPSKKFFFEPESFESVAKTLILFSPIWLFVPTLIGALASSLFAFFLKQFKPVRISFLFICELICTFFISPLLLYYFASLVGIHMHWGYPGFLHLGLHLGLNLFVQIDLLLLYPSIICLMAGIFVGNSLYNQFYSYVKTTSP